MHLLTATVVALLQVVSVYTAEMLPSQEKKNIANYKCEIDLKRLYDEWERNDEDKLDDDDDELLSRRKSSTTFHLKDIEAKNPEDLLKMTKKGETLLMFVNIRDPLAPTKKYRPFTEKYTELWRAMLRNNHIVSEAVLIDDDRAIFMFPDGSQAFEAKDFLLKQAQVTEITLEGQQYIGAGAATKVDL